MKFTFEKSIPIYKIWVVYWFYDNLYNGSQSCTSSLESWETCVTKHTGADVAVYQGGTEQSSCGTMDIGSWYLISCTVYITGF